MPHNILSLETYSYVTIDSATLWLSGSTPDVRFSNGRKGPYVLNVPQSLFAAC